MLHSELHHYLEQVIQIGKQAGDKIAEIYHQQNKIKTQKKADDSFVTEADIKAHHLIIEGLKRLTPNIPIISEEVSIPPFEERQNWKHYWCIDPLDGTYEFVHRKGEFVVSIALIEDNYPILGVLHVPLQNTTYYGAKNYGAFKIDPDGKQEKIQVSPRKKNEPIRVIVSRRSKAIETLTNFLSQFDDCTLIECSSALKFCLIGEGEADIYPRFGTTHEWDTAAGQCIVESAGGKVIDLDGNRLSHNMQESLKNPHFLAVGFSDLSCFPVGEKLTI